MNIIPKKTLYHASLTEYKNLKPTGVDLGNVLQKPGWSLFCWDSLDNAYRWAVMLLFISGEDGIYDIIEKFNNDYYEKKYKVTYMYPGDREGVFLNEELYNIIAKYLDSNNKIAYIYKFDVPINKIGLGNSSTIKEYTVREKINKFRLIKVRITSKLLRKYVTVIPASKCIDEKTLKKYESKYNYKRKFSKIWNRDFENNVDTYKKICSDLHDNKIKTGDNLNKYFKEQMNFDIDMIFKSMKFR